MTNIKCLSTEFLSESYGDYDASMTLNLIRTPSQRPFIHTPVKTINKATRSYYLKRTLITATICSDSVICINHLKYNLYLCVVHSYRRQCNNTKRHAMHSHYIVGPPAVWCVFVVLWQAGELLVTHSLAQRIATWAEKLSNTDNSNCWCTITNIYSLCARLTQRHYVCLIFFFCFPMTQIQHLCVCLSYKYSWMVVTGFKRARARLSFNYA